jgi:hypothetical protein
VVLVSRCKKIKSPPLATYKAILNNKTNKNPLATAAVHPRQPRQRLMPPNRSRDPPVVKEDHQIKNVETKTRTKTNKRTDGKSRVFQFS